MEELKQAVTKIQTDLAWLTYLVEKVADQLDQQAKQNQPPMTPEQIRAEQMKGMADDGYGGLI